MMLIGGIFKGAILRTEVQKKSCLQCATCNSLRDLDLQFGRAKDLDMYDIHLKLTGT